MASLKSSSMSIPCYPDLGCAIRGVCRDWCEEEGYSDPFYRNGECWAFPPNGVMPIRIKTVIGEGYQRSVKIGSLTLSLFPDGSLAPD